MLNNTREQFQAINYNRQFKKIMLEYKEDTNHDVVVQDDLNGESKAVIEYTVDDSTISSGNVVSIVADEVATEDMDLVDTISAVDKKHVPVETEIELKECLIH